ncbi:MAG: spondin domain-containing protein [Phycisphaeraceae bacterium]|nr:MAG: spondin domain-containing protein [Phycisphaeraceae bacterium]
MQTSLTAASLITAVFAGTAFAAPVQLEITVQNRAPANSVTFSPLRVGFHNGLFDAFDAGSAASAGIEALAELGAGDGWFAELAAADPTASMGTVGGALGPRTPGTSATEVFMVDASINNFFSYGAMVVPSNDNFIGNDDAMGYQILDGAGNLLISSISLTGADVWNAGTEVTDPATAAFLVGSDAMAGADENGTIFADFSTFAAYAGLATPAGYNFDPQFGANDEIYRISFRVVPAPAGLAVVGVGGFIATRRRRA